MTAAPNPPAARRTSWRHVLLLTSMACVLAACGGGGSGVEEAVAEPLLQAPGRATVQQTDRQLDLAIFGDGMFPFIDAQGRTVYSRTARLGLDEQNRLINADGAWLAGEPDGTTKPGEPQALAAIPTTLPARASRTVRIELNLNACVPGPVQVDAKPLQVAAGPRGFVQSTSEFYVAAIGLVVICPEDMTLLTQVPEHGGAFMFTHDLYDTRGRQRAVELHFVNTAGSVWQAFAIVDGDPVGAPAGTSAQAGVLRFDPANGTLDPTTARWTLAIPAHAEDPGDAPSLVEFDLSNSTQYSGAFRVRAFHRDGYPAGELQQIVVDGDDLIRLRYSNGQERLHGRVLLARFSVADRMRAVGETGWLCEQRCAGPRFAAPTTQLTGQVRSGYLEPTLR